MSEINDQVLIRVEPVYMIEDICVMIPPKYWNEPKLADAVKRAILMTQNESAHMEDKKNERQKASRH